jgi:hypothetical protein
MHLSPVRHLQNVLPTGPSDVTRLQLRRLQTAAMLDGKLETMERSFLDGLRKAGRVAPSEVEALDRWIASPSNPEVAFVRKQSPRFEERLRALEQHAKPGDLVFWHGPADTPLGKWLGEWTHVSLALGDGLMLDTMSLEGATISDLPSVLAKAERRLQSDAFAIGKLEKPLTAGQLDQLRQVARRLQGRDYALVSRLDDAASRLSCSRSVYEALKQIGLEVVPETKRLVSRAVMPGDLMRGVKIAGTVDARGVFRAGEQAAREAWNVGGVRKLAIRTFDRVLGAFPGLWPWVERYQARALERLRHV